VWFVLSETVLCTGMALLARGQNVGFGKSRLRVCRRQHIVMPMAVVAGSDIRRYVRLSKGHGFAVVGIAIMLEAILVTTTAFLIARHLEVTVLGGFHLVRRMAVRANRTAFVSFREQPAVDALIVDLFHFDVALAAGFGDVRLVNGR